LEGIWHPGIVKIVGSLTEIPVPPVGRLTLEVYCLVLSIGEENPETDIVKRAGFLMVLFVLQDSKR
jgi:hypothetical protein